MKKRRSEACLPDSLVGLTGGLLEKACWRWGWNYRMSSEEVRGEDDLSAGDRDRERRDSRWFATEVAMKLRV